MLIDEALHNHEAHEDNLLYWQSLTLREQETVALICLNYTTRQIASKLHLSPETIKTHAENAMRKCDIHTRQKLRMMLHDWDFSAWDR